MRDLIDKLTEHLGLDPVPPAVPIEETIRQPHFRKNDLQPYKLPASPEDLLARKAAAEIEREEGYFGMAEHRLNGAYDGDTEHRIALAAIRLVREQISKSAREREGEYQKPLPSDQ